ncbi:hypothetical protein [Streptomyces prunicolor]
MIKLQFSSDADEETHGNFLRVTAALNTSSAADGFDGVPPAASFSHTSAFASHAGACKL